MMNSDNSFNNQANQEMFALLSQYFAQRGQFLAQIIRADLQSMSRFNNYNGNGNHNGVANYNGNGHGNHNGVANHNGNGNHNGVANHNGNGHGTAHQNHIASNPMVQPVSLPKPVVQQQPPQPMQPVAQQNKSVEAILVNSVVQQTGYPQESIDLELKLLDDLNLDSIKAGELVAEVAKECGVAGQLDPSALANASLKEVAAEISSVMPVEAQVKSNMFVTTHNNQVAPVKAQGAQTPESSNWVRNFSVEYVAQER